MDALLSIITPVYNVEKFLDRCVGSILSQSYSYLELILIDDGSTDGSSALCDKWADKDKRIIVVHQENKGVSAARNTGLAKATGFYITFVDPDDFLAPDTYKDNMDYMQQHPDVDILQYPYCHYFMNHEKGDEHRPKTSVLVGSMQIFSNWWSGAPLEYVIWNKIYKRQLWDGISFIEGHTSEDTSLVASFVKKASVVYISEKGLYYYQRDRMDSYTYEYDSQKHLDLFYAHADIYECFKEFPYMVTEKVQAFTRLYRRLIVAKKSSPHIDVSKEQMMISKGFPSWREIFFSKHTDKQWLFVAKILGTRLFITFFLFYLNHRNIFTFR